MADFIAIGEIKKHIGQTNESAGTQTTGSVMGKLNGIFNKLNILQNIKDQTHVSTTGVGKTIYSNSKPVTGIRTTPYCIAKFIAPISGVYKATIDTKPEDKLELDIYKVEPIDEFGKRNINPLTSYNVSNIGNYSHVGIPSSFSSSTDKPYYDIDWTEEIGNSGTKYLSSIKHIDTQKVSNLIPTINFFFYCSAGEWVQLIGTGSSSRKSIDITKIDITYQP